MPETAPRIDYRAVPKQAVPCACCATDQAIQVAVGDRFGFGIRTVACARCGLLFTSPRPDAAWFDDFYRRHYRHFYEAVGMPDEGYLAREWIRSRHAATVERLLEYLRPEGRLLDVGCAEGTFLHLFRSRLPGWEIRGVEPSETFSVFARDHYGLSGVVNGSVRELHHWPESSFDLVTANHLLEHLLDPNELFVLARRLLRPGGLLFVDAPDAEGCTGGIQNLHIAHLYHFSMATLGNLFAKHGFAIRLATKGSEVPQWTLQFLGARAPEPPRQWAPAPVEARRIARAFARHCFPSPHRRVIRKLRKALTSGR